MPHLIVEYSADLERDLDVPRLVAAIQARRWKPGYFPSAASARGRNGAMSTPSPTGIPTTPLSTCRRASAPAGARSRQKAAEHIFAAVKAETAKAFARRPLG